MKPIHIKGEFVFCIVSEEQLLELKSAPKLIFREQEGTTIVIKKKIADKLHFKYENIWAMITLSVHSDLNAVGLLAKISNKLAEHQISLNVISAYYHDHLFVPIEKLEETMESLKDLSK